MTWVKSVYVNAPISNVLPSSCSSELASIDVSNEFSNSLQSSGNQGPIGRRCLGVMQGLSGINYDPIIVFDI